VIISQQNRFLVDGAVLDNFSFVIRYFDPNYLGDDRLFIVNLGKDFEYDPIPEPLLAPSKKGNWELIWSSEEPKYGGQGVIFPNRQRGWKFPAHSAMLLRAVSSVDKPLIEKKLIQNNSS
jgi:maltooligosyltrehalose trehalohydrolase